MANPLVLAKYQQFVDDFNSGVALALLGAKYDIPEQKFDSYLEFLRRKLHGRSKAAFQAAG